MHQEVGRASIWELDQKGGSYRIYASGLRNPNGLAWEPDGGALWTVVNERDEIGSDLVSDYLASVTDGSFFGWPYSYFGQHLDERVQPQRSDLVAKASARIMLLGRTPLRSVWFFQEHRVSIAFRQRRFHRPARLLEP